MRNLSLALVLGAGSLLLTACGGDNDADPEVAIGEALHPRFDPANGVLPFPNNLLFTGSTDGTLNIPLAGTEPPSDPRIALNSLDGFSTVAPLRVELSALPAEASLTGAVVLLRVTVDPVSGAVTGVEEVLTEGEDYEVALTTLDPNNPRLEIRPLLPLLGSTAYLAALTDELADVQGRTAAPSQTYGLTRLADPLVDNNGTSQVPALLTDAQARALEPLRRLTRNQLTVLEAAGVDPAGVILSWTFTTQSIGDVLAVVRQRIQANEPPPARLADTGLDSPLGAADLYQGTVQVPYYLAPATFAQDTAPLTDFWRGANDAFLTRFNPAPVVNTSLDVPLLAAIPKGERPAGGWPVVIFAHGVLRDRTDMQFVADALAGAGLATLAMDLPLHGVTDPASPFYRAGQERTFDLDLLNNAALTAGPDGQIDPTGAHFINLTSLPTARDNLRQGVTDMLALVRALDGLDLDGDEAGDFDPAAVRHIGYSLGGIVGGVFLAQEPQVGAAVLPMAGGGIAQLLANSGRYGGLIQSRLAAAGLPPGTQAYEDFLAAAQAVVDPGDAINYTAGAVENRGVLIQEIIDDQTIPNRVAGAPLSGTEPLARVMGLMPVGQTITGNDLKGLVRFTQGLHASFLDPTAAPAVTQELQRQATAFLASDGARLPVTDAGIVQQP